MNIKPGKIASAIASILACSLLAACGGGGGGMVRSSPPPTLPPPVNPPPSNPPPSNPPPVSFNPCPAPVDSDCVVTVSPATSEDLPAMQSNYALIVRSPGSELSVAENSSFSGGTRIEEGTLAVGVDHYNNFTSDVSVAQAGRLLVYSQVTGNVDNAGYTYAQGVINGNVFNQGTFSARASTGWDANAIFGNFNQSDTGVFHFELASQWQDGAFPLHISGRAQLGGLLELAAFSSANWPFPAPGRQGILHADGGVFGTFDHWTSPGLFIEGNLRYDSNDVWFDLTRISAQAAMAGQGFGGITLASAGNIDRALAAADGFAGNPGIAQQQFLASAGRLLWMRDPLQARRALDTLSGLPQAQALDAALHEAGMSPALSAHLDRRARTHAAGAWSQAGVAGTQTGFDQWLGPHLLAGVHAARGNGAQADTMLVASTQRDERSAGAYLRWFGNDGWYAGADAGYAQRTMLLDRAIDFGAAGRWNAHSRRTLDVAGLGGETGRRLAFVGGSLTPFLRLDASAVRGTDTIEQGSSGFELALDPVTQRRLATSTGLRYARDWRFANGGWLQLQAGGGVQQTLWQGGDAQRAAFTGAPGAWFDLPVLSPRRSSWLDLGLHGGFDHDWRWAMQGMRSNGNQVWQLRLARDF